MVEPVPEIVPVDLAEIAVIEAVIDPQPVVEAVMIRENAAPVGPDAIDHAGTTSGSAGASPSREEVATEPVMESPTIDDDTPRLFIPDALPIEDAPLPPEIQRFAPWTWSWMEIAGVGLTIGAILSALSLLLWYVAHS